MMDEADLTVHRRSQIFDEDSEDSKIYLSVLWSGGRLGSSFYDTFSSELNFQLDIVERDDFEQLRNLLRQVRPQSILTSSKQDERFVKAIREMDFDVDEIEILPSSDYSVDVCKRRLLTLASLPGMPNHFNAEEKVIYVSSLVPPDSRNAVKSAGALLKHLDKKRVNVELENRDVHIPVLSVKQYLLNDIMAIDDNSLSALQVFRREHHPSTYKTGNASKEGLSLFGICNKTRTLIGSRRLKTWFMRPSRDLALLTQRFDAVDFLSSPRNSEIVASLRDSLKHVSNVLRILTRMVSAHVTIADWKSLYKTAYNSTYIGATCKSLPQEIEIFRKIGEVFTEDLQEIAGLIDKIVDFEESRAQHRFVVKLGVDEELDRKKDTYSQLPDLMTKVAEEELAKLDGAIKECNVLYFPQVGYILAIPCTAAEKEANDHQIPGLEFVYWANDFAHYKSARTKELDATLGDTQNEIRDYEHSIMRKLESTILEHTEVLFDVVEYAADLDCLMALAMTARENNFVKPDCTAENVIRVERGRHPLQELCTNPFVPNDVVVEPNSQRMKILTGPNASGKSVYLKQVALIVYMAHVGSFVPADSALIGLTDRIFTRIHSRESVSVGLSTFMIDLNQTAVALQSATESSLVLIDEFGKGTSTVDGLALLTSSLRFWLKQGERCPKVFVSTHFHSLVQQDLLPSSPYVHFQTMDVMCDGDDLIFLYELKDGQTTSSHACHIAAEAGVPEEVIVRAKEVSKLVLERRPIHRIHSASAETRAIR
ncbi:mutS protein homolog 5-like isoform X2 [Oscarella lobularis]